MAQFVENVARAEGRNVENRVIGDVPGGGAINDVRGEKDVIEGDIKVAEGVMGGNAQEVQSGLAERQYGENLKRNN